ncbi:phenolic acid decarboxylase [Nocardia takedensis]|uniref:phenolic acid decarboxylase n=1 Tax=Nocardia takedensis TaxID=259390 RepID=UPI003F769BD8
MISHEAAAAPTVSPTGPVSGLVGHRFIYTYANGWQYEMYVKNERTIDYRIHSGMVGGRWVRDQTVELTVLPGQCYKIGWTEPTGTSVVVNVVPAARVIHGTIFFPRWVHEFPSRTVLFQNDHLDQMRRFRDLGPTYPLDVVSEHAEITWLEYVGPDDETVIAVGPESLPPGFAARRN